MAATSRKKSTRGEKKSKHPPRDELTLEFIQQLGGTKEDLRLVEDIADDDTEDLDLAANDFDTEPIKKDELRSFMEQLGIFEHRPDSGKETDIKKKKLLTAPVEEESDEDATVIQPASDPTTEKKTKKKEKNKFKQGDAATETSPNKGKEQDGKKAKEGETVAAKTDPHQKGKTRKKEKNKFKVQHDEISSTTTSGVEDLTAHLKTRPQRTHLLVKPGDTWLDDQAGGAEEVTKNLVQQCEEFAAKLLEDEVTLYKKQREKSKRGESNWIRTVLTSGTLTDKIAALTVLVQESPMHNMASLDSLIAMTKKKSKREAMLAADTMKNVFVSESSPLPDDRKLIAFGARPFSTLWTACSGNKDSVDRRLMTWYAEDLLRQKYSAFVKALDLMSYDTLLATKEKALSVVHSLLMSKPEQEDVLLPMLVNKLGDPNHKVASKASYLLIKLVEQHPNMKAVIVKEVERLVYRPNVAERAQYYAICFLNQIKFHKADHALATQLIAIFFSFFKSYVSKGEVDSKMMAALLSGVNRAYPYAKLKPDFLSEQMATLYKIVHVVNFNTSVQALMLLHQVVDPSNSESDRYFMALYRKLLDPALRTSAKQAQFLNLVYKSMKADIVEQRVKALLKRLLQAGALLGPNFLCGALIVVSEILKVKPSLLAVKQLSSHVSQRKDAMDHILKKAAGKETAENRPSFLDNEDDDDDDEEKFVDLPVPEEFQDRDDVLKISREIQETEPAQEQMEESEEGKKKPLQQGISSWVHRQNLTVKSRGTTYDPYQRNPLHCNAQNESLWELQALTRHYHPSVSLFARTILQGKSIAYTSDPLQDFTLIRFLDRFVYKNPKKKEAEEGRSETVGAASGKRKETKESVPVNSAEFIQGGEEAVPEHERYLYRYFSQLAEKKKKVEEDAESDAGSISDSEFDNYLDKYERQMDDDDLGDADFGIDIAGEDDSDEEDEGEGGKGGLSDEEIDFGDDDDDELAAEFRKEMEALGEGSDDDVDDDDDEAEEEDLEDEEDAEDEEEFSGDELKEMMAGGKKRKKSVEADLEMPMGRTKKQKRKRGDVLQSLFASADDFADVLEGNAEVDTTSLGTLDAVSNSDKASAKQIAWESKRDRQTHGRDWKQKRGHGKPSGKGGKPFRKGGNQGGAGRRHHGGKRRK